MIPSCYTTDCGYHWWQYYSDDGYVAPTHRLPAYQYWLGPSVGSDDMTLLCGIQRRDVLKVTVPNIGNENGIMKVVLLVICDIIVTL